MNISKNVKKFYESLNVIEDHRYKSWEHCYRYFKRIHEKDSLTNEEFDLAQLHLAFYLASWGMYRGSSFILQKDYTIFKNIVRILLSKKYFLLWDLTQNVSKKELPSIFEELYSELEIELIKIKNSVKSHPDLNKEEKRYLNERKVISPTLSTKIILGTIGCIPAYDRFFIAGLKSLNLQQKFNPKKSFSLMVEFYLSNKEDLDLLIREFKGYPLMKILDMYFWVLGNPDFN